MTHPGPARPAPARHRGWRYALAAALGVAAALAADALFVPAGWRLLLGLGMAFSLAFAGVFVAAITDPRLR